MTLLGLDFDNTLVHYDKLFHQLAVEKDLIEKSLPADKTAIRDHLRNKGQDEEFTLLQGEVYGFRIQEAEPAEGMKDCLMELRQKGITIKIISHKTKTPYRGPKYNLHDAAFNWLELNGFFDEDKVGLNIEDIYLNETKREKIDTIHQLGCNIYVDDLPEILECIEEKIERIHYNPGGRTRSEKYKSIKTWRELIDIVS